MLLFVFKDLNLNLDVNVSFSRNPISDRKKFSFFVELVR